MARKFFSTLYNTYSFFALYANVDGFDPEMPQVPVEERPEIDRWILSLLNTLVKTVKESLDDYELTRAARAISEFVNDNLSNWYVRLCRKRFWGGEMDTDKLAAYQTLYTCLLTVAKLIAPFAPFYADRLYRDLTATDESVHLTRFPEIDEKIIDKALEERMATAQTITSLVLSLRRRANIKVRQPLLRIMVPAVDEHQREAIAAIRDLITNEVNVKDLQLVSSDDGVLVKRVKPDFKKLGPKHGKMMKQVAAAITGLSQAQIAALEKEGSLAIDVNGQQAVIDLADVEVISEDIPGWLVANEGNITVALDITITDDLRQEGIAREIVNRVQNIRKSRDYDITDRINVTVAPSEATDEAIRNYASYIARQVLADSVSVGQVDINDADSETLSMDDMNVVVNIALNTAK